MGRPKHEDIKLADITISDDIQQRAGGLDKGIVAEYEARMKEGDQFDAIVVFRDDSGKLWLADGFHRVHARVSASDLLENGDLNTIKAVIKSGSKRDAILYACGANSDHGKQRTRDDKWQAVETLVRDEEWAQRSDRWIAEACRVSHPFVAQVRKAITDAAATAAKLEAKCAKAMARSRGNVSSPTPAKRKGKDGKVRKVKVKVKGKPRAGKVIPVPDDDEATAETPERKSRGKGVALANEAIDCLKRIPKNDALRSRGYQLVSDWVKRYSDDDAGDVSYFQQFMEIWNAADETGKAAIRAFVLDQTSNAPSKS